MLGSSLKILWSYVVQYVRLCYLKPRLALNTYCRQILRNWLCIALVKMTQPSSILASLFVFRVNQNLTQLSSSNLANFLNMHGPEHAWSQNCTYKLLTGSRRTDFCNLAISPGSSKAPFSGSPSVIVPTAKPKRPRN